MVATRLAGLPAGTRETRDRVVRAREKSVETVTAFPETSRRTCAEDSRAAAVSSADSPESKSIEGKVVPNSALKSRRIPSWRSCIPGTELAAS